MRWEVREFVLFAPQTYLLLVAVEEVSFEAFV